MALMLKDPWAKKSKSKGAAKGQKAKPIKKQRCPPGYYWKDGGCKLDDRGEKQKRIQEGLG